jgi:DNA-binding response OmpR family regulator
LQKEGWFRYNIIKNLQEGAVMKKILIIEDDKDMVHILKSILELEGYKTVAASDGKEGINAVKREMPDVIVLDLILPKMDGNEVCRRIKRDPELCKIPVIILTAKGTTRDELEGIMDGADDYITKPFNPLDLIETIKHTLEKEDTAVIEERRRKKINRLQTRLLFEDEG